MIKSVTLFNCVMILMFISLNGQNPLQTEDYKNQEIWVDSVYNSLSIDQKIGQLFTIWVATKQGPEKMEEVANIIKKNHLGSRKIKLENDKSIRKLNNIFSIGLAILSRNPNLGIASSLSLDRNLINNLSKHSVRHEIEADDFMINKIQEFDLNTNGLINFFKLFPDQKNHYFQSHPRTKERVNILNKYSIDEKKNNSLDLITVANSSLRLAMVLSKIMSQSIICPPIPFVL